MAQPGTVSAISQARKYIVSSVEGRTHGGIDPQYVSGLTGLKRGALMRFIHEVQSEARPLSAPRARVPLASASLAALVASTPDDDGPADSELAAIEAKPLVKRSAPAARAHRTAPKSDAHKLKIAETMRLRHAARRAVAA